MMEQCLSQMSCLTKIRQLEFDVSFLEDSRSRSLAALTAALPRYYQPATSASEPPLPTIPELWAPVRDDRLNVQWRTGCLAGLRASLSRLPSIGRSVLAERTASA